MVGVIFGVLVGVWAIVVIGAVVSVVKVVIGVSVGAWGKVVTWILVGNNDDAAMNTVGFDCGLTVFAAGTDVGDLQTGVGNQIQVFCALLYSSWIEYDSPSHAKYVPVWPLQISPISPFLLSYQLNGAVSIPISPSKKYSY